MVRSETVERGDARASYLHGACLIIPDLSLGLTYTELSTPRCSHASVLKPQLQDVDPSLANILFELWAGVMRLRQPADLRCCLPATN